MVMSSGTTDDPSHLYENGQLVFLDATASVGSYMRPDGSFFDPGEPPSTAHYFDSSTLQWVPDVDAAWHFVRNKRNQLLAQSDWTQLPDVPIATKEVWAVYRQALRDVTEQADPFNIVWPTPPM